MSQPPNICIYCGGVGRSKEHYWGRWLHKELPFKHPNSQHTAVQMTYSGNSVDTKRTVRMRQGPLRNQQIKGPCVKCNTGWMRETNELARKVVLRLAREGPWAMCDDERLAFSRWAIMLSMTYEYKDIATMVTTQQERSWLMTELCPPASWGILVGSYNGEVWAEKQNHRAIILIPDPPEICQLNVKLQTNIWTIGRTVVNTISGLLDLGEGIDEYVSQTGLRALWPSPLANSLATNYVFGDQDLDKLASGCGFRFAGVRGVTEILPF